MYIYNVSKKKKKKNIENLYITQSNYNHNYIQAIQFNIIFCVKKN